mmetsp:Transcript_3675/g.13989  ORF Transcript_3675/g.13989 Transcript_3675/m.13989 type:complete len:89 (-) Transcript_3675:1944-2210(-)
MVRKIDHLRTHLNINESSGGKRGILYSKSSSWSMHHHKKRIVKTWLPAFACMACSARVSIHDEIPVQQYDQPPTKSLDPHNPRMSYHD